jgi:hypothetical protein
MQPIVIESFFSDLHEFNKKRLCHQELPTTFEAKDVQA